MPIFSRFWSDPQTGSPLPMALELKGPCLQVELSVSRALAATMQANQQSIPAPHVGMALIDTGASVSCVDQEVLMALGLNPTGMRRVVTPSGASQQPLFACELGFPGTPIPAVDFTQVIGSVLSGQGIVALIGRDILRQFILIYNGAEGNWTLAF